MSDTSDQLNRLGTATISDALDRLGLAGQCERIFRQSGNRCCGPAFTVRFAPVGQSGGTVGDYLDDVPPGSVIVLDNGGRTDMTVWGGLLSLAAQLRGIAGTVVHGAARDVTAIVKMRYPLFTRSVYMRTGKDRVVAEAINQPVALSGVRVEPGDVIVADADGVAVIQESRVDEVLEIAREIANVENRIAIAVRDGVPLRDARTAGGYHQLQSPKATSASDG